MVASYGTLALTLAKWQFVLGNTRNVLSVDLPLVTAFTEMCVSPTEPLCDFTAETTFERDVFLSVALAVRGLHWTAPRTY